MPIFTGEVAVRKKYVSQIVGEEKKEGIQLKGTAMKKKGKFLPTFCY